MIRPRTDAYPGSVTPEYSPELVAILNKNNDAKSLRKAHKAVQKLLKGKNKK